MRIAVPIAGDGAVGTLADSGAVRFYEDDHGAVTRRFTVDAQAGETPRAIIERHGVDVLLCGALTEAERRELAEAGLLLSPGASGDADSAVRAYLGGAVVCDPGNDCNYCGHKNRCALPHSDG